MRPILPAVEVSYLGAVVVDLNIFLTDKLPHLTLFGFWSHKWSN